MLNQFVFVGKVKEVSQLGKTENGHEYATLVIEVVHSYKTNGVYKSDLLAIKLWNAIAKNSIELCTDNGLVGVKGRIQSSVHITNDNVKFYNYELVAEKVSFLKDND